MRDVEEKGSRDLYSQSSRHGSENSDRKKLSHISNSYPACHLSTGILMDRAFVCLYKNREDEDPEM